MSQRETQSPGLIRNAASGLQAQALVSGLLSNPFSASSLPDGAMGAMFKGATA